MMFIVVIVTFISLCYADIPPELKACKKADPAYSNCLKEQIQNALKLFSNGYKPFRMLPLDPLVLESVTIISAKEPVKFDISMDNAKILGYNEMKVLDVTNDWKEMHIIMETDKMSVNGHYKIDGKIITMPINGDGNLHVEWLKARPEINITFTEVNQKGKKYFKVTNFLVNYYAEKVIFNFENLFNGNKQLGDATNKFINENANDIVEDIRPAISKSMSEAFSTIANKVFLNIPADQLDI